ncbi:MAG: cbb3-type cytochrome c oxidase subunit I [Betaproteobacteria bacterium]|nr:cbb3-type cytochrome c oxidase subunit I [Betaproteobacteria bacterium]MBI2509644.1 cbb3-type cytochrome c oxidase subunit I [Betaproteobacteria bacterium]
MLFFSPGIGAEYHIPDPRGAPRRLAQGWLLLGVAALAVSGLYSILIVLARTPGVHDWLPWSDFFRPALVVHVNLAVAVWFIAFGGVLWSLDTASRSAGLGWAAFSLCALGTAVIATAPLAGPTYPLLNNYVPVLRQPYFFAGLAALGSGFALLLARSFLAAAPLGSPFRGTGALRIGLRAAATTAAVALAAFAWSFIAIGEAAEGEGYFEYLFWGGGHLLQFTHTVLMLVCWAWLASVSGAQPPVTPKTAAWLFVAAALPAAGAIPIYLLHDVLSTGHRVAFTRLMEYGGLAAVPLGAVIAVALLRARHPDVGQRPLRAALTASVMLFATGGILGFLIRGTNVVVPAHYHGCIVGVTLAFMGLTYHLLDRLGFAPPAPRLAWLQPYIYGGGQLLHILGLAWSGGYGVQRKTASAAQVLEHLPEIAGMALMGLGGLIAIVGGLLFVIVVIWSAWTTRAAVRGRRRAGTAARSGPLAGTRTAG